MPHLNPSPELGAGFIMGESGSIAERFADGSSDGGADRGASARTDDAGEGAQKAAEETAEGGTLGARPMTAILGGVHEVVVAPGRR